MDSPIIYWVILGSYLIGALIFLAIIERKFNKDENKDTFIRKQQADSGMIICSILWLPLILIIFSYIFTKRIFGGNEK